jgi:hypothetical protein
VSEAKGNDAEMPAYIQLRRQHTSGSTACRHAACTRYGSCSARVSHQPRRNPGGPSGMIARQRLLWKFRILFPCWSTRDVNLETLSELGCLHNVLFEMAFCRLTLDSPPYLRSHSLVHRSLAALSTFVRSIHAMSSPTVASIPECTARVHAPAAFIDAVSLPAAASGAGRRPTHRRSL